MRLMSYMSNTVLFQGSFFYDLKVTCIHIFEAVTPLTLTFMGSYCEKLLFFFFYSVFVVQETQLLPWFCSCRVLSRKIMHVFQYRVILKKSFYLLVFPEDAAKELTYGG